MTARRAAVAATAGAAALGAAAWTALVEPRRLKVREVPVTAVRHPDEPEPMRLPVEADEELESGVTPSADWDEYSAPI